MRKDKEKKQRVLASLVMGLNCVNSFAPLAQIADIQENVPITPRPATETVAQAEEYTAACYQALDIVDNAVFSTAEAFTETVNAGVTVSNEVVKETADTSTVQNVLSGGKTVSTQLINNGSQVVSAGGFGSAISASGGVQILSGGSGYIKTLSANGEQIISAGSGSVSINSAGTQTVIDGYGYMASVLGGTQIGNGGTAVVVVLSGGTQIINAGRGSVSHNSNGHQIINGGSVNNATLKDGGEQIVNGGTAVIRSVYGGTQTIIAGTGAFESRATSGSGIAPIKQVISGGTGLVGGKLLSGDVQLVSGGTGSVNSFNGTQTIFNGGTGLVNNCAGGTQTVSSGAYGYMNYLSVGKQIVYSGATSAYAATMGVAIYASRSGVEQYIESGASASIGRIQGGTQYVATNATGTIEHISNGFQKIEAGGTGIIENMDRAWSDSVGIHQQISSGGYGSIGIISQGYTDQRQEIASGGSGKIDLMMGGSQFVPNGAVGSVIVASSQGFIFVYAGGTTTVDLNNGGQQEIVGSGGTSLVGTHAAGGIVCSSGGYVDVGTMTVPSTRYWDTLIDVATNGSVHVDVMDSGLNRIGRNGTATMDAINDGRQYINAGGTVLDTNVYGGTQIAQNSSYVSNNLVRSGGTQILDSGTPLDLFNNVIESGGQQIIQSRASITNQSIGSGGTQAINNGGTASITSTTIINGSQIAAGLVNIASGAEEIVNGLVSKNGGTVAVAGTQTVNSGGTAIGAEVKSGGEQNLSGGVTDLTVISSGGEQAVNGGTSLNTDIQTGAAQTVTNGSAVSTNIANGASQTIIGGTGINTNIATGGLQTISGGTGLSTNINAGALQNVVGGTAQDTIVQNGGSQVVSGGTAAGTNLLAGAQQTIFNGSILGQEVPTGVTQQLFGGVVDGDKVTGGTVEVYNAGASFKDVMMNAGLIRFGADGGDYNISGTFDFRGGLVDMTQNPDGHNPNPLSWESLTINNLLGQDGIFKLDTDLDSAVIGVSDITNGDKVVIEAGDPNAKHYIQVVDKSLYTGTEIAGGRKLLLVTDDSNQNFTMMGKDLNNGGLWFTHAPELVHEGNKWYLGYIEKEATNDTSVLLNDRQTVYNQWARINNDTLRKRLGDLRYNDAERGIWARFYKGRLEGETYSQNYSVYQLGIDKTSGKWTYGLALDKQDTTQGYEFGSGNGSTKDISIYATQYTDTGSYLDLVAKYGKVNSKYDTYGDFPDHADYDTPVYSISVEYGKTNRYNKGYFFEPKVQLTYGYIGAENYYTDRKTLVEEDTIKSIMARIGIVAGRKINDTSDYYFKAGIFREFKGERFVHLRADNGENMYTNENYKDTWFELGIGGNIKLANKTHLYGDIERSFAANIQKKWQANIGIRWEF